MNNKWNSLDETIFKIESQLKTRFHNNRLILLARKNFESEPDEETFSRAQSQFYKNEYEELRKYRIPNPLVVLNDMYVCPKCKTLICSIDQTLTDNDYCPHCGQRIFIRRQINLGEMGATEHKTIMADSLIKDRSKCEAPSAVS